MHVFAILRALCYLPELMPTWFRSPEIDNNEHAPFLQAVYKALDKDEHGDVVAFYTDFSKAFDKVSH